jgi:hypothetical protein
MHLSQPVPLPWLRSSQALNTARTQPRRRDSANPLRTLSLVVLCLSLAACRQTSSGRGDSPPIVGTWFVKAPEAPFPFHVFVFHSDGTVQQANPDAGDPNTSDSNGMGIWLPEGDTITGKLVEITADRTTRQFVSRGEISFSLKVNGNSFRGTASATFYDADGQRLRGPLSATLEGQRVLP